MSKIEIADGLTLPQNAAVQVYAFMGRRGSGKTFGAGRLVEQVIGAGGQVVILDPVGTWWGLRLAANGKSPGIPVPVFGGLHGDIPLEATAGKVVAELAAERATSLVLDVSSFTGADQRRFVADFATEFFQAKKRNRSAVLVVMEEAQEFAPQRVGGETARMVGAVERMIKLGRNFGIGTVLVSQRPQAINKDVLNQSEVMFCFQMTGPQERKTIEGWVQEKGAGGRDIGDQLPSLPVGTALMWSPQWLGLFGKYKILRKSTYDASATPDGTIAKAASLAPIDLDQVKAAMAATVESAKANDPSALKREVARLRAEVAAKPAAAKVEGKPVPAISEADFKRVERLQEKLSDAHLAFSTAVDTVVDRLHKSQMAVLTEVRDLVAAARQATGPKPVAAMPAPVSRAQFRVALPASANQATGDISKCARALLAVLAQRGAATDSQISALSGYRKTSSSFSNGLSELRTKGLIDGNPDRRSITDAGRAVAGHVDPLPAGPELLGYWLARLTKAEAALLKSTYEAGTISRSDLSVRSGYSETSSSFTNAISGLRTLDLVTGPNGGDLTIAEVFRS